MSEDTNQTSDELFDHQETESGSDAESTTDPQETEGGGEEIKHTKAEEEREKQINSFLKRVKSGDITADKIPHKWIQKEVEARLAVKEPSVNDLVQKAIKEEKEAEKYATLREKLNEANLTEEKRQRVTAEYKELVDSGLSKAKALEKAIAIAGVKFDSDIRFAARIPKISNPKADPEVAIKESLDEGNYPSDLPIDKRVEYFEKLRERSKLNTLRS